MKWYLWVLSGIAVVALSVAIYKTTKKEEKV